MVETTERSNPDQMLLSITRGAIIASAAIKCAIDAFFDYNYDPLQTRIDNLQEEMRNRDQNSCDYPNYFYQKDDTDTDTDTGDYSPYTTTVDTSDDQEPDSQEDD